MTGPDILVLTDFSDAANAAEQYALAMARKTNAAIRFVYAAVRNGDEAIAEAAHEEFDELEQKIKSKFKSPVRFSTHVIITDNIHELVNDFVRTENIGLIIMGTHGSSGIDKMFGSTTLRIIKSAHVPVIAVPINARFHLKKIVMASDNVRMSARIKALRAFAKNFNAFITVLNVVKPRSKNGESRSSGNNHVELRTESYPAIEFSSIEDVDVPDGIQRYLSGKSADLLTLFPERHGVFDQLLGRSITRRLTFETKIPLLIFNNI
jgi:nucleotide-binding universal stress UspA family protein